LTAEENESAIAENEAYEGAARANLILAMVLQRCEDDRAEHFQVLDKIKLNDYSKTSRPTSPI
jgi:hypothetical protein